MQRCLPQQRKLPDKPHKAEDTGVLTDLQTLRNSQVNTLERNSPVNHTAHTVDLMKQATSATRTEPEKTSADITEELWWKDIHEPISNIVEIIQKQYRSTLQVIEIYN